MKKINEGFTLMETLLTIAIVIIISSILVVAFSSSLKGFSQHIKAVNTAITLSSIDRYIRIKTNDTNIPYWTYYRPHFENLSSELYHSRYGSYIKSINIISNARGIEVIYTVNNHETRTIALFPSVAVVREIR